MRRPIFCETLSILISLATASTCAAQQPPSTPPPQNSKGSFSQNPAEFIEVIEMIGNRRILHYSPKASNDHLRSRQFEADNRSTLLIRIIPDSLDVNVAMSNLLISANLVHDKEATNVEVLGYSVVGEDKNTAASQNAVSTATLSDLRARIENLFYTSRDIVATVYNDGCIKTIDSSKSPLFDPGIQERCKDPNLEKMLERARHFKPEIDGISSFFTDPKNGFLGRYFSNGLFGMDYDSLKGVAGFFKNANVSELKDETKKQVLADLAERSLAVYLDIAADVRQPDQNKNRRKLDDLIRDGRPLDDQILRTYLEMTQSTLIASLKYYLVDGQIILSKYKAARGDRLNIKIESKGSSASDSTTGSVLHFEVALETLGVDVGVADSMFFLKRIAVTQADVNRPVPISPINFGPAPGASFGFVYRYRDVPKCVEAVCQQAAQADASGPHPNYMRGASGRSPMRALAPGLALNVSFMNWSSVQAPSGSTPTNPAQNFDVTTGKFNSNAASIQVGAGYVVSLFGNKLQFTQGWNLQVPTKRAYWGVGFGFIEVGKAMAGLIKSK